MKAGGSLAPLVFLDEYRTAKAAHVVCRMPRCVSLGEGIAAISWQDLTIIMDSGSCGNENRDSCRWTGRQIAKDTAHRGLNQKLFHARTNTGIEAVDVLEDLDRRRIVFGEAKRRRTVPDDTHNLRVLHEATWDMQREGWAVDTVIVTTGDEHESLPDGTTGVRRWGAEKRHPEHAPRA